MTSNVLAIGFATPRLVACRVCRGTGRGRYVFECVSCNGVGGYQVDDPCLATLSHNLSIAAGLCAAFEQGCDYRMRMMLALSASEDWKPGCGKAAP